MSTEFEIIPAIDLIEGKCVRLSQGDYTKKIIYNENPLEIAKEFEDAGINRLHLVDLDGAKKGEVVNLKVLETLSAKTRLNIDFGGGIKTENSLKQVFEAGALLATIGSIAVKDSDLFQSWVKHYGAHRFFLGADVKNENIAIGGWLETTEITVLDFIAEKKQLGLHYIFCTDISKDGLLAGPSTELYKKILQQHSEIRLIASGGVSSTADLQELKTNGCSGAIIGKALYEGKIKLTELMNFSLK